MKLEKKDILTPLDYKNELLTLYKSNHLDIALKKSIFYLKGNGTDVWLLNFVGTVNFKLSNFKNAISYYDKILANDVFPTPIFPAIAICLSFVFNLKHKITTNI